MVDAPRSPVENGMSKSRSRSPAGEDSGLLAGPVRQGLEAGHYGMQPTFPACAPSCEDA